MSLHVHNTDVSKIVHLMLTTLVLGVSSLTLETDDVVIVQEDDSIMLNCTYRNDSMEYISNTDIRWQKQIGNEFKDIAAYSPPGGFEPFIVENMRSFYDNRTKLIAPNTTLAAVLIIKNPSCSDVGTYQCWMKYTYPGSLGKNKTSLSTISFSGKARLPEKFMAFPDELEENQSISLVCNAGVGSPWGNIKIWKILQYSDTPELIYTSNSTKNKTNKCTNVTTTYTVTKDDNGAIFRCSSQNNLTRGPGPSKDSQNISVLYGPYMTTITLSPSKSVFTVGESLTIQCITDSNPLPTFKWYFRPNGTFVERPMGLTENKLEFGSLQITDSGTYICTAANKVGSNSPNATARVSVFVRRYYGCSQCRYIEICHQNNDEIECIPNKWVPTAVVFMTLSVAFAVSSIVLLKARKKTQENITSKHMNNTRPHPPDAPEDNGGGYASPSDFNRTQEAGCSSSENICDAYSQSKDFIKKQEQSLLLTHHNEPDGHTTTQEVVQYAAVQKKSTKDQVSDENVYDSAWNSDNVFFKLRPDTQGPHRSPEQH